jgi:hypothetical protein
LVCRTKQIWQRWSGVSATSDDDGQLSAGLRKIPQFPVSRIFSAFCHFRWFAENSAIPSVKEFFSAFCHSANQYSKVRSGEMIEKGIQVCIPYCYLG